MQIVLIYRDRPIQISLVNKNQPVQAVLTYRGSPGPVGRGFPPGGTVGQIVTKLSATDYDADWRDPGATSTIDDGYF
jgi:hypothetical protein